MINLHKQTHLQPVKPIYCGKKINICWLRVGPYSANCDLRLENAFSRPQSQFFTIQTFQLANNIYMYIYICPV